MSIKVRVVGDLQRFVEPGTVEIDGGRLSLSASMAELVRRYPLLGRELFDEQGRLHYAVVIALNGRRMAWPDDGGTIISDDDEVMVTRFHCGG